MERAEERRREVSRVRERCVSRSDWLGDSFSEPGRFCERWVSGEGIRERVGRRLTPDAGGEGPYRPDSKVGDARAESSVVMVKMPSNLRSGRGAVMEAEMRVRTLVEEGSVSAMLVSLIRHH